MYDPTRWTESSGRLTVADSAQIDLLGLSDRDRNTLKSIGMLDPFAAIDDPTTSFVDDPKPGGTVHVTLGITGRPIELDIPIAQDRPTTQGGVYGQIILTPDTARNLGLEVVESGWIGRTPEDLTAAQREAANDLSNEQNYYFDPFTKDPQVQTSIQFQWVEDPRPWALIRMVTVGGALLLTLLVVAISLALSAAEARDERDVLLAIGAKPGTVSKVAGWKAALLAFGGCLLAIPTGFLPVAAVITANNSGFDRAARSPIAFPWGTTGLTVVAIPLIAGLIAWFGSTIVQHLRPARMSTLIAD